MFEHYFNNIEALRCGAAPLDFAMPKSTNIFRFSCPGFPIAPQQLNGLVWLGSIFGSWVELEGR